MEIGRASATEMGGTLEPLATDGYAQPNMRLARWIRHAGAHLQYRQPEGGKKEHARW